MTSGEFKKIVLPCYKRMYATAFALLRNSDDASDAVQDVMAALWRKHSELAMPDDVQAFCNRTVRNACIDRLRSGAGRYMESIDSLRMAAAEAESDSEASYNTTRAYICDILMKFNEKHRVVLMLGIFSQLSNDEISVVTGESSENVRAILSRGRRKIKECMKNGQ